MDCWFAAEADGFAGMSASGLSVGFLDSCHHGEVGDKTADSTTVDDSGARAGEPTTVGKMDAPATVHSLGTGISASDSELLSVTETSLTEAWVNEKNKVN